MLIKFRDLLGMVVLEIASPIDFLNGKAYFTDSNGNDIVIPMETIECIMSA